ncbi:MAG: Phosphate ABC transporter, periplasmic phosphate-binding protein PstS, partial [uncultured Acetobacteraceae bacterium]
QHRRRSACSRPRGRPPLGREAASRRLGAGRGPEPARARRAGRGRGGPRHRHRHRHAGGVHGAQREAGRHRHVLPPGLRRRGRLLPRRLRGSRGRRRATGAGDGAGRHRGDREHGEPGPEAQAGPDPGDLRRQHHQMVVGGRPGPAHTPPHARPRRVRHCGLLQRRRHAAAHRCVLGPAHGVLRRRHRRGGRRDRRHRPRALRLRRPQPGARPRVLLRHRARGGRIRFEDRGLPAVAAPLPLRGAGAGRAGGAVPPFRRLRRGLRRGARRRLRLAPARAQRARTRRLAPGGRGARQAGGGRRPVRGSVAGLRRRHPRRAAALRHPPLLHRQRPARRARPRRPGARGGVPAPAGERGAARERDGLHRRQRPLRPEPRHVERPRERGGGPAPPAWRARDPGQGLRPGRPGGLRRRPEHGGAQPPGGDLAGRV